MTKTNCDGSRTCFTDFCRFLYLQLALVALLSKFDDESTSPVLAAILANLTCTKASWDPLKLHNTLEELTGLGHGLQVATQYSVCISSQPFSLI